MNKQHLRIFIYWILFASLPFSHPVNAASPSATSRCQVEKAEQGWQYLNASCDIGTGLWGKTGQPTNHSFWLQCHYGKSLPNRAMTAALRDLYPNHFFLVPDRGNVRCLVGPFQTWPQAVEAKKNLAARQQTETFIRQTRAPVTLTNVMPFASSKQPVAPSQTTLTAPSTKLTKSTAAKKETLIDNRVVMGAAVYAFTYERLNYHQPMNISSEQALPPMMNKENGHFWSKVNYQTAENWCRRFGLRLPTVEELTALHTYGQHHLLRLQWPIQANYWSSTLSFYSGEIKTLNLRSGRGDEYRPLALLYTTCVGAAD
ncbi:SPOR domain-containing protein [Photobacterium sp. TY1-4]|uniref:SPOR domain-containing protein n=1 Tax=Photobacterium sp. TY1-4 TaxID=2899122 RepID=UPI0021C0F13A|nr:SPOR domain-containing protein [Photobacterium sp. TY1-4]UXI02481.1 SPOR domain-containing protein [Photobacterium sp. TY1-4]